VLGLGEPCLFGVRSGGRGLSSASAEVWSRS